MKRRFLSVVSVIMVFLMLTTTVFAEPVRGISEDNEPNNVGGSGDYIAKIVETGVEYDSVQLAIDSATTGQTVQMNKNSKENIIGPAGKNITLDLNGKVLQGDGTASVVSFKTDEKIDFTIKDSSTNAYNYFKYKKDGTWTWDSEATSGIDISAINSDTADGTVVKVKGGAITGGIGTILPGGGPRDGGGIQIVTYSYEGTVTLQNINIVGNTGDWGGGIYIRAVNGNNANVKLNNCLIAGNYATFVGGGAHIEKANTTLTLKESKVSYNTVRESSGGGLNIYDGASATLEDNNCSVDHNSAPEGGGISVGSNSSVDTTCEMKGGTISYNASSATLGMTGGGGVYVRYQATFTMSDGTISNNTAAKNGGGILTVKNSKSTTITGDSKIIDNISTSSYNCGAGMDASGPLNLGGNVQISGNTRDDSASNLFLRNSLAVNVNGPSDKMSVGVTTSNTPYVGSPVAVTSANSADYCKYFKSDIADYVVINDKASDDNQVVKLAVSAPTAIIYEDGYMVFQEGGAEDSSHGAVLGKYTGFTKGMYEYISASDKSKMPPWYADGNCANVTYVQFKDTIKPENTAHWFRDMKNLKDGDFEKLDGSIASSMAFMFQHCEKFNPTKAFSEGFGSSAIYMNNMFYNCYAFNPKNAFPEGFGSKAQYMVSMFTYCRALTMETPLPEGFGSEAINMSEMFQMCMSIKKLTNLPSSFGAKVKYMNNMFYYCINLTTLDISSIDTSAVIYANLTFSTTPNLQTITIGEKWGFEGSSASRMAGLQFPSAPSDSTYGGHWACLTGTNKGTKYTSSTVPNGAGTYTWSKNTTVTPGTDEFTYDGDGHRNELTVVGPSNYETTIDPEDEPVAAGTHNETYTVTPDTDDCPEYEEATGTVTTKINKVQLTIEGTTANDKYYDGTKTATVDQGTVDGVIGSDSVTVVASAAFASEDKGTHDVTVTYSLDGEHKDNYLAPKTETLSATINAAPVVLSDISASEITYGQSLEESTITGTAKSGDTAIAGTWTWKTATTKPAVADSDTTEYDVTFTPTSDNYQTTDGKVKLTVAKKQLEIAGTTVADKTYDGNTSAEAAVGNLTNKETGDAVTVAVKSAEFADKNAGEDKPVTVTYEISGTASGNYLAPEESDEFTATIFKKQLNISTDDGKTTTVSNKTYDGTTDAKTLVTIGTVVGAIKDDDVEVKVSSADFADKKAGQDITVTVEYELSGSDANNYIEPESDSSLKATISPKPLFIKGTTVAGKTFDNTYDAEVTIGTLEDVIAADADSVTVSIKSATFANKNVGTGRDVAVSYEISGAAADCYEAPEDDSLTADITARDVTVTADSMTMDIGDNTPEFTAQVNGVIDDTEIQYFFMPVNPNAQGVYSIVPAGITEQGNYNVIYNMGTLTVTDVNSEASANGEDLAKVLMRYRGEYEYQDKVLDVEVRTGGIVPQSDKDLIIRKAGYDKKIIFANTELYLIVNDGENTIEKNIGDENIQLIGVSYRFDFSKKENIQVFRAHENADNKTAVDELTETPNAAGEYVVFDKNAGLITVYAKKYSTYAFAYDDVKASSEDSSKDTEGKSKSADTGDSNNLLIYFIMLGLATAVFPRLRRQQK